MKKTIKDLKVGDEVFFTSINFRGAHKNKIGKETVTKIGNKIIHCRYSKFRIDTLVSADNYGHEKFYLSEAEIFEERHKDRIISSIRYGTINFKEITIEKLIEAGNALGINTDE